MFELFNVIFFIMFFGILGMFVFRIGKLISVKISNDNSPIIEKRVKVVDKRTSVSHYVHNNANGNMQNHNSTYNYITFEAEDRERTEFLIKDKCFGLIVVGDIGVLKFQGTRFLEFNRDK